MTHSLTVHASIHHFKMADFYLRYYVGHKGKFGHEFLEFEFRPEGKEMFQSLSVSLINFLTFFFLFSGKLRYANNSNYKNDVMIRKEVSFS